LGSNVSEHLVAKLDGPDHHRPQYSVSTPNLHDSFDGVWRRFDCLLLWRPFKTFNEWVRFGAFSPIGRVLSHRPQSAESGPCQRVAGLFPEYEIMRVAQTTVSFPFLAANEAD
jgi:hypothetical protein